MRCRSNQELNRIEPDADRIPFRNQSRIAENGMNDSLVEDCQVIKVHRALDQAFKYFIINTVSDILCYMFHFCVC